MRYKTLFRLVVKVIGLWLFAQGLPQAVATIGYWIETFWGSAKMFPDARFQFGAVFLQLAVGLYFFFGGRWIVNMAIPSNRPYCPECTYDLTGAPVERCPECGTAFRWEDVKPKIEVQSSKFEK